MKNKHVLMSLALLTMAISLSCSRNSYASVNLCGSTYYNTNEELIYSDSWHCNWDEVLSMWDKFDFDKGDWDDGFGFYDACNDDKPLKRTFNALQLLKYAGTSYPETSQSKANMLLWAYNYAAHSIDELDAACGKNSIYATTRFGIFIDNKTVLYTSFFYDSSTVVRASTIVHEARHAQGWCSHKSCGCRAGGKACDRSLYHGCTGIGSSSGKGAYGFEVIYLYWFINAARQEWTTSWNQIKARAEANSILYNNFCESPCLQISPSGNWKSTCNHMEY